MVDDRDFDFLNQWKWTACESKRKHGPSAWCAYRKRNGKSLTMHHLMGELMLGGEHDLFCDHRDRNGLNNQRSNIRPCTNSQNNCNMIKAHGVSRFKGVDWKAERSKWRATIKLNGRQRHIGYARTEENAATAYNFAADELFGEFALFNTP